MEQEKSTEQLFSSFKEPITKFLKDNVGEIQVIPDDVINKLFPAFERVPAELKEVSNKWIVISSGKTEDVEYQVVVQEVVALENTNYHLFILNKEGKIDAHIPVKAASLIPPVSEKRFGLDFFDWLEIQGTLLKYLRYKGLKEIDIDINPVGKMVYTTKEKPDEVLEKIKKGETYQILSIKAEVFFENLKKLQEKDEKKVWAPEEKKIIT